MAAKAHNLSEAARCLSVSQPAISRSISEMEEALGYALFHRTAQGVQLTPEGEDFLEKARQLLETHAEAQAALRRWRASKAGNIRVGGSASVMPVVIPALWRKLHAEFGGANVSVLDGSSTQVQLDILAGRTALGICSGVENNPEFRATLVMEAQLGLILPSSLPLPDDIQSVHDLSTLPLARYGDDFFITRLLREQHSHFAAYFNAPLAVNSIASAIDLVQRERIAVVASGITASNVAATGLRFVALPSLLPKVRVYVISRRADEFDIAQEQLRDILQEAILETPWHPSVRVIGSCSSTHRDTRVPTKASP